MQTFTDRYILGLSIDCCTSCCVKYKKQCDHFLVCVFTIKHRLLQAIRFPASISLLQYLAYTGFALILSHIGSICFLVLDLNPPNVMGQQREHFILCAETMSATRLILVGILAFGVVLLWIRHSNVSAMSKAPGP